MELLSFLLAAQMRLKFGTKITPWGRFYRPWPVSILKSWHQDLSNEGSNFILSLLEVGQWVAQVWPVFDKLPEISDFGHLQESENKAWFWIC